MSTARTQINDALALAVPGTLPAALAAAGLTIQDVATLTDPADPRVVALLAAIAAAPRRVPLTAEQIATENRNVRAEREFNSPYPYSRRFRR